MSLLGNLSEPITREDLLNLGWERISKNTLTTQIHISPQYYDQDHTWYSYNYWEQPVYYDVKRRMMRIRDTIYRNISDMMELNMIIESYTTPKIEVKCK